MRNTAELRAVLSGCRHRDIIASLDRLCAENAEQQRRAQERLHRLEQRPASRRPERSAPPQAGEAPAVRAISAACLREAQAQIDLLTQKLAAAQAELRRYQTRLFAYERENLALRRENAELEALCDRACQFGIPLDEPAAPAWKPRQPAARPEPPAKPALAVAERADVPRCVQAPSRPASPPRTWTPRTTLERLASQLLDQMDRLLQA